MRQLAAAVLLIVVALAIALGIVIYGPLREEPPVPGEAVVTIRVAGREEYRVRLTDPDEIATARALLDDEREGLIPIGQVVRGETGVNEGWSWHIDPATFEWVEVATEVCDGLPSGVEDATITSERYCPWAAEVVDIEALRE